VAGLPGVVSASQGRERNPGTGRGPGVASVNVFLVDPHPIYRRGLAALLEAAEDVESVAEAEGVRSAASEPALAEADVILLDGVSEADRAFIRERCEASRARVIMCTSAPLDEDVIAAVQAGAVGYLCKETLTPEALRSAIRAAADGASVMPPEMLGRLLEPRGLALSRLTAREQKVLSLVADGRGTREVAAELCYSERTIKNVLHDVVVKLNARTRSEAVAHAVREGLI
jgi:DNA-binding NarL/FixJ family response regulator